MCGRYAITSAPEAIRALFAYHEQPNFPPRYNVAPTQPVPVVRLGEGKREFVLMRWGLLPAWVKDPRGVSLMIMARGDSVNEKPAFRAAMRRRRCVLPADGFYEWKQDGEKRRPHYVRLKSGGPMALAGLWETWTGPNGEELDTVAVVTTRANRTLSLIHDRMPVIVPPNAFDLWLDCRRVDAETASALIMPARDELLQAHEVSLAVNRAVNDGPALIEPLAPGASADPAEPRPQARKKKPPDDSQPSLFGDQ
jgi:putative SOS response-associated peptidase YedK